MTFMKKTAAITAVLASTFALGSAAQAGDNPFAATALPAGYQLAQADTQPMGDKATDDKATDDKMPGKMGEAKCGSGKKAAGKKADGRCGSKKADAKCGADKKMDAKCGGAKK